MCWFLPRALVSRIAFSPVQVQIFREMHTLLIFTTSWAAGYLAGLKRNIYLHRLWNWAMPSIYMIVGDMWGLRFISTIALLFSLCGDFCW